METWTAFKPKKDDIISLNPDCFDEDSKKLKPLTKIKINDHNSFSIAKDKDRVDGIILSHLYAFYSLKEVIKIIYMFIFRKHKKEYVSMQWTNNN